MRRRPPRSTPTCTLFPYTTVFRAQDRFTWGAIGIAMIHPSPKKFLTLLAVAVSSLMGSPAFAETPERVETLVVYGEDPCPQEHDGAIVVCARKPESERYRIPKELRKKKEVAGSQGWEIGRTHV